MQLPVVPVCWNRDLGKLQEIFAYCHIHVFFTFLSSYIFSFLSCSNIVTSLKCITLRLYPIYNLQPVGSITTITFAIHRLHANSTLRHTVAPSKYENFRYRIERYDNRVHCCPVYSNRTVITKKWKRYIYCISIIFLAAGVKIAFYSWICIAALHAWLITVLCIKLTSEFVISRFLRKIKNIDYCSQLNVCRIWCGMGLSPRVRHTQT
jgi:hypothetical protein